jgi:hypothetical protein
VNGEVNAIEIKEIIICCHPWDRMMSSLEAPSMKGLNVPAGCILVNEIWRGSNFEAGLSG